MNLDERKIIPIILALALVVSGAAYVGFLGGDSGGPGDSIGFGENNNNKIVPDNAGVSKIKTFSSEQDFKQYLLKSSESENVYLGGGAVGQPQPEFDGARQEGGDGADAGGDGGDTSRGAVETDQDVTKDASTRQFKNDEKFGGQDDRISGTNVQETGIDEPDILKIGDKGDTMYFSPTGDRRSESDETKVINSQNAEEIAKIADIDATGNLLLVKDTLVVISKKEQEIEGYDVSNPKNPNREWSMDIKSSVVTARLLNGEVYLVLKEKINRGKPCPVRPLERQGDSIEIRCDEIYHPNNPVQVDVTYNAISLNPQTGEVQDKTSFVGSAQNSVVYMSKNSLYVTYTSSAGRADILLNFFLEDARDLIDDSVAKRLKEIRSYDLSEQAKMVEVRNVLQNWQQSLEEDKRRRIKDEIENRYEDYVKENKRKFKTTGIVEISVDDLEVKETGNVPGTPLNQFSMDEKNGNLRIATTIPGNFAGGGRSQSENDLYVLDKNLDIMGSVKGMGVNERIYSVRFIGDKGYVVTFRRIDPFHVIDLSDPDNPTLEGKLKLPGFSSYLHPLSKDRILGIGEENGKVKAVIFDVSNPNDPVVEDDYILNDRWSEISQTHHAFLLDKKHKVFFLPGSEGGYIFSYDDGLSIKRKVETERARRAAYVGDKMYVFSNEEVVVLNEKTWDVIERMDLDNSEWER